MAPLAGVPCDVDADGDMDIVRINEWNGHSFYYTLQVFLNNGVGGFTAGYRYDWENNPSFNEGQHLLQIVPGDFDNDGFADLAVLETYEFTNDDTADPYREEGRIIMRWNDRAGGFAATTTLQSTGFDKNAHASAADMDRDGDLDLVCDYHQIWNSDDAIVAIDTRFFTNNGSRTFSSSALSQRPSQFTDVNRDGWPDVANSVYVALNGGDGTLNSFYQVGGIASDSFVDADADGDARLDQVESVG
ncbi:MAG: VCBS repeat-containing protein, partial [Verrucomicrobia bacterium]|nr:VCBS repeat-containing protein [Verrucomicrobiota bacterium]